MQAINNINAFPLSTTVAANCEKVGEGGRECVRPRRRQGAAMWVVYASFGAVE
jgi:hypothetical protein